MKQHYPHREIRAQLLRWVDEVLARRLAPVVLVAVRPDDPDHGVTVLADRGLSEETARRLMTRAARLDDTYVVFPDAWLSGDAPPPEAENNTPK